ncbi:trans-aconitate 2-methyltransferase [Ferviditalea candida]|uniref:Methyltransferase domain-containing protein n=1 Tax=Ferviditalea candida TaxID=3108399 RepID=A0ABU5ZG39_9BACL|nr:methyltransferase domain-containing protein [Paenibacillaceae bacterium T2]
MKEVRPWNAALYDSSLGFVSRYGQDLLQILKPAAGEKILDLGCGTGDLADEMTKLGADVTGLDASEEMISRAREKYPELRFIIGRAESFRAEEPYDAVFSNAALHWVKDAKGATESIWEALRPGGRFVAEFGGKGNVRLFASAIEEVLASRYDVDAAARNPWYYPSIGEYASLLEQTGFDVVFAELFDRPTPLGDEQGIRDWLSMFARPYFSGMSEEQTAEASEWITGKLTQVLARSSEGWLADYRRLRIVALKRG